MNEVAVNEVELNGQLIDVMVAFNEAEEQHKKQVLLVKAALEKALYKVLPANSQIQYSSIDWDWNGSTERWALRWRCEITNVIHTTNSGIHFYFGADKGVEINNACIGCYSKEDKGYIAAIKMMAAIWDHIDQLEADLSQVDTDDLLAAKEQKFQAESAKSKIEYQLAEIRANKLAKEILVEGTEMTLMEGCWDDLFKTRVRACKSEDKDREQFLKAVITHITPKKVLCTVTYSYYFGSNRTITVWLKKDVFLAATTGRHSVWSIKTVK